MTFPRRLTFLLWIIVLAAAAGWVLRQQNIRVTRAQQISALAMAEPLRDASASTGYAHGVRHLIVPEHFTEAHEVIMQAQAAAATGAIRLRSVDYDNAPQGRSTHSTGPYRWCLQSLAAVLGWFSSGPAGIQLERAALYLDPCLQLAGLLLSSILTARWFGPLPAIAVALGWALLFPLSATFQPAMPAPRSLSIIVAMLSVLPLWRAATVTTSAPEGQRRTRGIFLWAAAGVAGGCGLWIDPLLQVPLLIGIGFGGLVASTFSPVSGETGRNHHWWVWSAAGSITALLGFVLESVPHDFDPRELRINHPLYWLAWLGWAELVRRGSLLRRTEKVPVVTGAWDAVLLCAAALAVLALPVAMWTWQTSGFLFADLGALRLDLQPEGIVAPGFPAWLRLDGFTRTLVATLAPCIALPLTAVLMRGNTTAIQRHPLLLAQGPLWVATGLALWHLRWWQVADVMFLVSLAALLTATQSRWIRGVTLAALAGFGAAGLPAALQRSETGSRLVVTVAEAEALIERDLAHWLRRRAGEAPPTVVAPPAVSSALAYYGGARTVASFAPENAHGTAFTLRVMAATSYEEAKALLDSRGVTHLVLPSWDTTFAYQANNRPKTATPTFWDDLHRWSLPNWLRPIAYQFPNIAGLEGHGVFVFEVVEEQEDADALSRLTEYFVETSRLDFAARFAPALERYPASIGALTTRFQVAKALNDEQAARAALQQLKTRLATGADRFLPLDRRIGLAVALARGGQLEAAKKQTQRCLAQVDEEALRGLSAASLYHFQMLRRAFELKIEDAGLAQLAQDLLPPDLRDK